MRVRSLALLWAIFPIAPAVAFPPYRSTDAGTAEPWVLEWRVGAARLEREGRENAWTSPLARLNLGLPAGLEWISEVEYSPRERDLGEAAVGLKWVPIAGAIRVGNETLLLLPIKRAGGVGLESQLVATWRGETLRAHLNGGLVYDGRPEPAERAWRASALGEAMLGPIRPGLELAAKRALGEDARVLMGLGAIVDVGAFDLRSGMHLGLSRAAPDLVVSLWIAGKWAASGSEEELRKSSGDHHTSSPMVRPVQPSDGTYPGGVTHESDANP